MYCTMVLMILLSPSPRLCASSTGPSAVRNCAPNSALSCYLGNIRLGSIYNGLLTDVLMIVITWNVQWCRGVDGEVSPSRIARTARALADFDVLCLQEVAVNFPDLPGSRGEDQMAELSAGLPGYAPLFGVATDLDDGRGGRRRFGNAIFSRLPVLQVFRHLLSWPADPASISMQRMALEAVLASPVGPLRVISTHLEYYSAVQRAAQVEDLLRLHVEACAHARTPRPDSEPGGPFEAVARPVSAILC